MEILTPFSPFLSVLDKSDRPQQQQENVTLLYEAGFGVSMAHILWLLNELVYFVHNPLPVFNLMGPMCFRTYCTDKMYLLRLYRLADFLCMPDEVLNSIALACFECFFLSDRKKHRTAELLPAGEAHTRHVENLCDRLHHGSSGDEFIYRRGSPMEQHALRQSNHQILPRPQPGRYP